MASLASLQEDKAQSLEQLEMIQSGLKDDPENVELLKLQEELTTMLALLDESLAEFQATSASSPPQKPQTYTPSPQTREEKWNPKSHVASKVNPPADEKEEVAPSVADYQVNDTVMAKWISGDKAFYPARITSITGSTLARVYIVKFKNYDETETLRAKDIRPMSNKRKADGLLPPSGAGSVGLAAASDAPLPPDTPESISANGVISAAARLYPAAQAAKESENNDAPGPPKAKKIKAKKDLEAGKSKWQEFSHKSRFGKSNKKDSMFRTPEGINARVGFTGSGQAMKKDPTRSRHIYQMNEDLD